MFPDAQGAEPSGGKRTRVYQESFHVFPPRRAGSSVRAPSAARGGHFIALDRRRRSVIVIEWFVSIERTQLYHWRGARRLP